MIILKRSIKFSKIFHPRCQNFVKIFGQKLRVFVENLLTLNDETNCDSGFLKIVNLKWFEDINAFTAVLL